MPEARKEKAKTHQEKPKSTGLYRSERNRVLAGVAGGLGEYFDIDPTIIRIIFILMTVFGGSGLIVYLVLWLIIPPSSRLSQDSRDTIRANIEDMKLTTRTFAHSISRPGDGRQTSKFWWAIIIVIVGFFFLMNNFGLLEPLPFDKLWPVILIIFGLAILLRK